MKLLQKTNRTYLGFSTILFVIAGCLLYLLLTNIIEEETNEKLYVNKQRIVQKIENGEEIPQLPPVIEVVEIAEKSEPLLIIKDTSLYDPIEQEPEIFREVTSIENINGKTWKITIRQVILEPHDYLGSIGLSLGIVMTLLLIGLILINRFISHNIWRPFHHSLDVLKSFSLKEDAPVNLRTSNIQEFRELNEAINKLTAKVRADYHTLKEFTENASHEIQTPLSVIQSKLELTLQSPQLDQDQAALVRSAYSASQRLSKLNQSLLLLTKIENLRYGKTEDLKLAEIIDKQLEYFDDFVDAKGLSVEKNLESTPRLTANPTQIETLISNLLSNAFKHNIEGGTVKIELRGKALNISNTGKGLAAPPEKMFERFTKADQSTSSLGLGLSIVQKICEVNGWQIKYTTKDNWHNFQIRF